MSHSDPIDARNDIARSTANPGPNTLNKAVSLAAGSHTLTVYARSNGAVTDKHMITFTVR